jgi:phytoene dehydrogenase-like protein
MAYLGKAGFSALILERLNVVGGKAITRDFTLLRFHYDVLFASSVNHWKAEPGRT